MTAGLLVHKRTHHGCRGTAHETSLGRHGLQPLQSYKAGSGFDNLIEVNIGLIVAPSVGYYRANRQSFFIGFHTLSIDGTRPNVK